MDRKTETLGEALPKEMARVRDEIMPAYLEKIGKPGQLAMEMMREDLDAAATAMAEGDVVKMMVAYEALKGYTT